MKKGVDYIGVSVVATVLNKEDKVLLSKRSEKTSNEHGFWEFPGGSVHFGETLEEAIKREIREELGIKIDVLDQFPASDHLIPNENQHWVVTTFITKIKDGYAPKIIEPEKCDEIGWFEIDNLPSPLSIITKKDYEKYLHKKRTKEKH